MLRLFGRRRWLKNPRAQVMIELAISFVAVVMLTYVTLKVWTWLSTNIMQRQAAFQTSRIAAGQAEWGTADVPGRPVNFRPVPLQIVGAPGATSAGSGGIPYPPEPGGCLNDARRTARLYQEEGDRLVAEAAVLLAQVDTLMQLLDLWRRMEEIRAQILVVEAQIVQKEADIVQTEADIVAAETTLADAEQALSDCQAGPEDCRMEQQCDTSVPPVCIDVEVCDPPDCDSEEDAVDAAQDQLDAYNDLLIQQQAELLDLQNQLLDLQNQLALLQAEYDAIKAGAGFGVDDSNMPDSMVAQRDAIYNQWQATTDLANWNYDQARALMAGGGIVC